MTIVKFFNGDIKEYHIGNDEEYKNEEYKNNLISLISNDIGIDKSLIELIKNENISENIAGNIDYFVLVQESKDYPFNCWENYFRAFTFFLTNYMLGYKEYTNYRKAREENGKDIDLQIMSELLETENPQEGLIGLVNACIDGNNVLLLRVIRNRYSREILPIIHSIVNKMLQKGALINDEVLSIILTPNHSTNEKFEDDMGGLIMTKGYLLKIFLTFNGVKDSLLKLVPDWDDIYRLHWKDMMDTDGVSLDHRHSYKYAYYRAMKEEMIKLSLEFL